MNMLDLFSDDEKQILQFSILWTFQAIAYADEQIEEAELNAMSKLQSISSQFDNELIKAVFDSIDFSSEEFLNVYNLKSKVRLGLHELAEILDDKISEEESVLFKKSLLASGFYIAKSSGKSGERAVGILESKAIKELSNVLRVSPVDLMKQPTLDSIIVKLELS